MMSDRLADIRIRNDFALLKRGTVAWNTVEDDVRWLVAEVERLTFAVEGARSDAEVHADNADVLLARALQAESALAALRDENATMINAAGCALGTDEALRSSACVDVLARQAEALRGELAALRELHAKELEAGYVLTMRLIQSDLDLDDVERAARDRFMKAWLPKAALEPEA